MMFITSPDAFFTFTFGFLWDGLLSIFIFRVGPLNSALQPHKIYTYLYVMRCAGLHEGALTRASQREAEPRAAYVVRMIGILRTASYDPYDRYHMIRITLIFKTCFST